MQKLTINKILIYLLFFLLLPITVYSKTLEKIKISGNERIADSTIKMLGKIDKINELDEDVVNKILKDLYNSDFFKDVKVFFNEGILSIEVTENPLIYQINFEGIKAKKNLELIQDNLILKERSSFNQIQLKEDVKQIKNSLKNIGYYFSNVESYIEELDENKVNINFKIDLV